MSIPHKLSLVIQRSHSLLEILQNAVEIIVEEMGTDVASIYLLDPDGERLRLMASQGLDPAAVGKVAVRLGEGLTGTVVARMEPIATEDAPSHPIYLYFPETREEQFRSYLGIPMGIRNRPVGAVAVQTRDKRQFSQLEIETLSTIAAQLVGVVENARLIEALDHGDTAGYLDEVRRWRGTARPSRRRESARGETVLQGSPASGGIAIGRAVFRGAHDVDSEDGDATGLGPEEERRRCEEAFDETRREILEIQKAAEREADEEHALIFSSHLLLLNDPVLERRLVEAIDAGKTAHVAVSESLRSFEERLMDVRDPYIQERVEDIRDLRSRILGHLLHPGETGPQLRERIVVTHGLPPSLVVELKAEGALGLVTEVGGRTSHGALLARSMGIPAVTGLADFAQVVHSDDLLIIDGNSGSIIVRPMDETLSDFEERVQRQALLDAESLEYRDRRAATHDGLEVDLQANIGVAADLRVARDNGADGVGLYRTEFPFIVRERFPTREEQIKIYARAYEFFPHGQVRFRLLDLGGDKFVHGDEVEASRDPFHGYRSIRVLLDYPNVLRDQVQAFAMAASTRPLSILIPLVSTLDEVRQVKALVEKAIASLPGSSMFQKPQIGAMVELPAAVEIAGPLAREVDYLSVGSNDLIQYSLAADRENPSAAAIADPYHPAILRMIRRTIDAAHAVGKPVTVCGEIASDERLALALVAMGVDALSVSPGAIPRLKHDLAAGDASKLRERLDDLLEQGEAAVLKEALGECFG